MRPIQRRRSSDGSFAKPTGETYSSRIDEGWYRRRAGGAGGPLHRETLADDAIAPSRAAFLFGHSAPDAGVLAGAEGPLEARRLHGARSADRTRRFNLGERGTGRADREEQFWIDVAAGRFVPPIHRRRIHATEPSPAFATFRSTVCEPVLVRRERARAYNPRFESGNTFSQTTWLEDNAPLPSA